MPEEAPLAVTPVLFSLRRLNQSLEGVIRSLEKTLADLCRELDRKARKLAEAQAGGGVTIWVLPLVLIDSAQQVQRTNRALLLQKIRLLEADERRLSQALARAKGDAKDGLKNALASVRRQLNKLRRYL